MCRYITKKNIEKSQNVKNWKEEEYESKYIKKNFLKDKIDCWTLAWCSESIKIAIVLLICQKDNLVNNKNNNLLKVEII